MIAVLGATGQIGGMVARNLLQKGEQVRAIVRNAEKAKALSEMGAALFAADYLEADALKTALRGVDSVLLLTPENPFAADWLADVRHMLENYRAAVRSSGIERIVLLSSMGAQHSEGTGNLLASHMLEQAFADLSTPHCCIRPAYYYSNWMGYLGTAKESGILPTFFPADLELPMIAPADVAAFIADVLSGDVPWRKLYEVSGPQNYSASDIAQFMGEALDKKVQPYAIAPDDWKASLLEAGFSESGAGNLADMTQAVIDGRTIPVTGDVVVLGTDFAEYLRRYMEGSNE